MLNSTLRTRTRSSIAALLLGLSVTACGESSTGPSDSLSAAELALLAQSLFTLGFDASFDDTPASAPGLAAAPIPFESSLDTTVPCPVSGNVRIQATISGVFDDETGAASIDYVLDQTHAACTVRSDDGSTELRIDGDPGTRFSYSIELSEGLFTVDGALTGRVRYATQELSGSCEADLTWSGNGGIEGGNTFAIAGTICGTDVSTSLSDG